MKSYEGVDISTFIRQKKYYALDMLFLNVAHAHLAVTQEDLVVSSGSFYAFYVIFFPLEYIPSMSPV